MPCGYLAKKYSQVSLELTVLKSAAGFYIGTIDDAGPVSRESVEYYPTLDQAAEALFCSTWTQRTNP